MIGARHAAAIRLLNVSFPDLADRPTTRWNVR